MLMVRLLVDRVHSLAGKRSPLFSPVIVIIVTGFIVPLVLPVRRRLAAMIHLLCSPASGGGHSITHFLPKIVLAVSTAEFEGGGFPAGVCSG